MKIRTIGAAAAAAGVIGLSGLAAGQPANGGLRCNLADIAPEFGALGFGDVTAFIEFFNGGADGADINNDGLVNFGDVSLFIEQFNNGCEPQFLGIDAEGGQDGDRVCLTIGNVDPTQFDENDFCWVTMGEPGTPFKVEAIEPGAAPDELKLIGRVGPFAGDQPGPIVVAFGNGDAGPIQADLVGAVIPDGAFRWLRDFDIPPVVLPFDWNPQPGDPMGKKAALNFENTGDGRQCLFLPDDVDWQQCDELEIIIRLWCLAIGRQPDIDIPRIVICNPDPQTIDVARAIRDAVVAAFNTGDLNTPPQPGLVVELVPVNGGVKIFFGYEDCEIDGGATIGRVCVSGPAEDCEEVCQDQGVDPQIMGVFPNIAAPGELVQIEIANWPDGAQFDDVCFAAEDGTLFDIQGAEIFDADGDGDLDAQLFGVVGGQPPFVGVGMPQQLMLQFGDGDRFQLEQQVPGFQFGEAWGWQPLPGGPGMILGGVFIPAGDPPSQPPSFTGEVNDNTADPCFGDLEICINGPFFQNDRINVYLRAYCPVRTPDVHIPDIVITQANPTVAQVANALCAAIISAYVSAGIPEIECIALPKADGSWRICIGYSDCNITGPNWGVNGENPSNINVFR